MCTCQNYCPHCGKPKNQYPMYQHGPYYGQHNGSVPIYAPNVGVTETYTVAGPQITKTF